MTKHFALCRTSGMTVSINSRSAADAAQELNESIRGRRFDMVSRHGRKVAPKGWELPAGWELRIATN